jgi:hypothetical protein
MQGRFGWKEAALALLIAILAYQVLIPFVMIVWASLKLARPGEPDFLSLSFTFANMRAPTAAPPSGAPAGTP